MISQDKIENIINDQEFLKKYDRIVENYENYMNSKNTWFSKKYPNNKNDLIAYFSAEYGLDQTIPIYSGGLGILSGDHLKSASDLGLPFVAVGLLYKNGVYVVMKWFFSSGGGIMVLVLAFLMVGSLIALFNAFSGTFTAYLYQEQQKLHKEQNQNFQIVRGS